MVKYILPLVILFLLCGCKRSWTEKEKSEFVSGCISGSSAEMGVGKARKYCKCMLTRIMDKYPNARDAKYLQYDSTISRMGKDCLNEP